MENALADLQLLLHGSALQAALPLRWTALKLLEGDEVVMAQVRGLPGGASVVTAATAASCSRAGRPVRRRRGHACSGLALQRY